MEYNISNLIPIGMAQEKEIRYAETHNLPLIRIPYTRENELEDIILEIIAVNKELNAFRIQKYKRAEKLCNFAIFGGNFH